MTDRVSTLTVILSEDMRDDDAAALADAICMLDNVAGVEVGKPVDPAELVLRARLRHEIGRQVLDLISGSQP